MDRSGWDAASWVDQELAGSTFKDERLGRRLRKLLVQMAGAVGAPLPLACQDWANTKAAYRFLSNEAVSEAEILAGHFRSTCSRVAAADGLILVLQDTTEFSYQRARPERIGVLTTAPSRRETNGRLRMHTVCGLLMHASLAVTKDGLPLGLAAIKFWTRARFKGTNALKRRVNPTRVPIEAKESIRWLENMRQATALLGDTARLVHIGDRENDIYSRIFADDTPLPVLDPGRGRTKTGRLWGYAIDDRPWGGSTPPAVVYLYAEDRKGEHPAAHLAEFQGVLQVDGYGGFKGLLAGRPSDQIKLAFCWAHCRRRFYELHQSTGSPLAEEALRRIGELYAIEAEVRGHPAADRL